MVSVFVKSPTLVEAYGQALQKRGWRVDSAQRFIVNQLQTLMDQLVAREKRASRPLSRFWQRVQRVFLQRTRHEPVRGLYVWGGVGRGKTFLMDLFFEHCPVAAKRRCHFHRFMRDVHRMLTAYQGEADPLDCVAEAIAQSVSVLCFDEFFVKDIGDAMILGNLFSALLARGVCLVATSNVEPKQLYADGLQRDRFLPAIALLEQHTCVVRMADGEDFRLQALTGTTLFMTPCNAQTEQRLQEIFEQLAPDSWHYHVPIDVAGRQIMARALADNVVWFEFAALCLGPRSVTDYIEVAEDFSTVLLGGVPAFGEHNDDAARRFIHLVDEFYDRHVRLIVAADVPVEGLYGQGRLAFEFDRTLSRLHEMQSQRYLGHAHG